MKKQLLLILSFFFFSFAMAQEKVEMADTLRSNGKIYTVVAVILTILLGLFLYLIWIDRKLSRLEKEISSK